MGLSSTNPGRVLQVLPCVHIRAPKNSFIDVKSSDYFADAVQWAVERNITSGTSKTTFSPNATCSKAQILTFLWHANGSPEPTAANPFADIQTGDYFYKAALWAAEKGLVSGSTFSANTDCTRAITVEYMWKAAGSPAPAGKADFDDVPANADYAQAVACRPSLGMLVINALSASDYMLIPVQADYSPEIPREVACRTKRR